MSDDETTPVVPVPRDLSVIETAALVGVSRARVYQRITGFPDQGAGRPLAVVLQGGRQRIPIAEAMRWRQERLAASFAVGPWPAWGDAWARVAAALESSRVTGIGMPGMIGVPTAEDAS